MRINRRTDTINRYIQKHGNASLRELCALCPDVSEMTVRRDLKALEDAGEIVRTSGGAKSIKSLLRTVEDEYSTRAGVHRAAKEAIAQKALACFTPGSPVYLDAGTTVMALARKMPSGPHQIVTSGPNIALEVLKNKQASVLLLGGKIHRENLCISGAPALNMLDAINIDTAFLAASGYSEGGGFTTGNLDECELKRRVIKKARRVVLLMDTSKLEKTLPYTFANLEQVDVLISERGLPPDLTKAAAKSKTELL